MPERVFVWHVVSMVNLVDVVIGEVWSVKCVTQGRIRCDHGEYEIK
jgi:hypothetical protein